jgi:hypothetical protein
MTDVALRKSDHNRKWFASFDKVIAQDASLDIYERVPLNLLTDFTLKILHLPVLWERYYDELIAGNSGSEIRSGSV